MKTDLAIAEQIRSCVAEDSDYWAFRGRAERKAAHALFQYPAMMVPQMQGELIDIVTGVRNDIRRVCDPFVGSGTILIESMTRGFDFTGYDINPLAVMVCRAKMGPYNSLALKECLERLLVRIASDRNRSYAVAFKGQSKWFCKSANEKLSKIRRSIERESNAWVRRVFWLTFAETIRRVSNSRTSTYKLHIKSDVTRSSVDPLSIFKELLKQASDHISEQERIFLEKNVISGNGAYIGDLDINLEDVTSMDYGPAPTIDLLVTSPPYGDNLSTVPYGQFSYLPSLWIPSKELQLDTNGALLSNSHATDSASLGGSNLAGIERGYGVCEISDSFKKCFLKILKIRQDHANKLGAFAYDMYVSLEAISQAIRPGGILIWTLGNRKISGLEIPLAKIVAEMLQTVGAVPIFSFERKIPSKRMAVRNNVSGTMRKETVLIMRMKSYKL